MIRVADIMARGAVQMALGAAGMVLTGTLAPFGGATGRQRFVRQLFITATGAGKLLWFRKIPLYHVEKAPAP